MTDRPLVERARTTLVALLTLIIAIFALPGTASAHTDFDSSDPIDGATVDGPISTVTLNFTNPAVESGDGFQLLDPAGVIREPQGVDATDGTSFVVTFDPPLEPGAYGLRWEVQAGDAHPIDGSFQFVVTAPAPATATSTSTTIDATATAVPVAPPSDDSSGTSLDEFLDAGAESGGGAGAIVGRVGRSMSMAGTIFAVGVIAALVGFVRGRRDELRALIGWVRLAGLLIIAGGVTELAALDEAQASGFGVLVQTKPGMAAVLKIVGGSLVLIGLGDRSGKIVGSVRSLSAAAALDVMDRPLASVPAVEPSADMRWSPDVTASVGISGVVAVLASYWFDGHTVSRGPWVLHALANLVHVGTAAVWAGGVFAMTLIALLRRRRDAEAGLAAMVVRFSAIAALSLSALVVAGIVMTWLVVDGPSDIVSTDWGRVLMAKVAVVAVAAAMGGYNHLELRPELEQRPDDPVLAQHLRRTLAIESAALVVVIVLTAVLVASAT